MKFPHYENWMQHVFGQFLIFGETVLDLWHCTSLHFSVICSFTDKPDPCGSGGSSNTAKTGKDFFSPKNRKEAALLWEVEVINLTLQCCQLLHVLVTETF